LRRHGFFLAHKNGRNRDPAIGLAVPVSVSAFSRATRSSVASCKWRATITLSRLLGVTLDRSIDVAGATLAIARAALVATRVASVASTQILDSFSGVVVAGILAEQLKGLF